MRRVCREVLRRKVTTVDSDGNRIIASLPTPCNSDKWTHDTKTVSIQPAPGRTGEMVVVTRAIRSGRLFCENGHPMGGE